LRHIKALANQGRQSEPKQHPRRLSRTPCNFPRACAF
jgi:hypothetical protein